MKQLEELVASLPEGACADLLILPLYAAMPLELQVSILPFQGLSTAWSHADTIPAPRPLPVVMDVRGEALTSCFSWQRYRYTGGGIPRAPVHKPLNT